MVIKRLLAGLGFGGASVETSLDSSVTTPGGSLRGTVVIEGGDVEQRIEQLTVGLQARVESESGDHEVSSDMEFHRVRLGEGASLVPGQSFQVPFELFVPWETPVTAHRGRHLHRMNLGVNTRLHVAGAVDPGDLDPVGVEPLPAQAAVLDSLLSLGFTFKHADLERGRIAHTRQRLPFYQEIEFYSPSRYQGLNELELSLVTDEHGMDVVLELDKKPGLLFSEGRDTFHRFTVNHHDGAGRDWTGYLHQWLDSLAGRRELF
ncbi:sporulation protein [Nocardiopsis sp. TSRI0078]|uniref:sporulation protein n=1 Tax=unclassified Nocardiopsis TaxID=2649073 RepID=UPI00093AD529|nr:sporulation protein [Nocardiopsis sp. TSRI0078]OKI16931.1 sporulation protein [Nocardiopsis sp. TSRI0078]